MTKLEKRRAFIAWLLENGWKGRPDSNFCHFSDGQIEITLMFSFDDRPVTSGNLDHDEVYITGYPRHSRIHLFMESYSFKNARGNWEDFLDDCLRKCCEKLVQRSLALDSCRDSQLARITPDCCAEDKAMYRDFANQNIFANDAIPHMIKYCSARRVREASN
jgi:hypothetical protein